MTACSVPRQGPAAALTPLRLSLRMPRCLPWQNATFDRGSYTPIWTEAYERGISIRKPRLDLAVALSTLSLPPKTKRGPSRGVDGVAVDGVGWVGASVVQIGPDPRASSSYAICTAYFGLCCLSCSKRQCLERSC
eukprot:2777437-Rhodomonas_salina.1